MKEPNLKPGKPIRSTNKRYLIDENHHFTGTEIDENAIELTQYGVIYMECE